METTLQNAIAELLMTVTHILKKLEPLVDDALEQLEAEKNAERQGRNP